MHRYRLSSSFIQFTSSAEVAQNSDYESDSRSDQRLTTNTEVIPIGNLLDQVCSLLSVAKYTFLPTRHQLSSPIKLPWKQ